MAITQRRETEARRGSVTDRGAHGTCLLGLNPAPRPRCTLRKGRLPLLCLFYFTWTHLSIFGTNQTCGRTVTGMRTVRLYLGSSLQHLNTRHQRRHTRSSRHLLLRDRAPLPGDCGANGSHKGTRTPARPRTRGAGPVVGGK